VRRRLRHSNPPRDLSHILLSDPAPEKELTPREKRLRVQLRRDAIDARPSPTREEKTTHRLAQEQAYLAANPPRLFKAPLSPPRKRKAAKPNRGCLNQTGPLQIGARASARLSGTRCYCPSNFGGRFSRNAATPSTKSRVAPALRCWSRSKSSCAARSLVTLARAASLISR
jgi:hypothetical protein